MKTVKTYLVRKPSDLDEVLSLTQKYGFEATEVKVAETIKLDEKTYQNICNNPLADYNFLAGKGGYDDNEMRQVIALSCKGKQTLYADPSGSSYCRYLGIKVNERS